jgi:RIP metalloprotease RseP
MAGLPEAVPGIRGVLISSVEDGMPASDVGIQVGDIIVAVDGTPLTESAGAAAEDSATAELDALIAATDVSVGQPMQLTVLRGVERVQSARQVDQATTEPVEEPWFKGDRVVAVGGATGLAVGDVILESADQSAPDVIRGGSELQLAVTPVFDAAEDKGRMGVAVSPAGLPVEVGPLQAVQKGVQLTGLMFTAMVQGLSEMVARGDFSQLSGPVGIAGHSRDSAQGGIVNFLGFMALLSLNLGLINLFPIPALDGGRLLFIALEALRGRRMEPSREQLVHVIGFVVVIGLMIVLTFREVAALVGLQLP